MKLRDTLSEYDTCIKEKTMERLINSTDTKNDKDMWNTS